MYKLEILASARGEILEIARLHKALVGPISAKKITEKIRNSLSLLRTNPNLGILLEDKEMRKFQYRKLICDNYLCFYRVIADKVFIYHIVDGRTDYPRLFGDLG
jgi:plasmid stabilization system protein ParE